VPGGRWPVGDFEWGEGEFRCLSPIFPNHDACFGLISRGRGERHRRVDLIALMCSWHGEARSAPILYVVLDEILDLERSPQHCHSSSTPSTAGTSPRRDTWQPITEYVHIQLLAEYNYLHSLPVEQQSQCLEKYLQGRTQRLLLQRWTRDPPAPLESLLTLQSSADSQFIDQTAAIEGVERWNWETTTRSGIGLLIDRNLDYPSTPGMDGAYGSRARMRRGNKHCSHR